MNISGILSAAKGAVKTGMAVAGKWATVHAPELALGGGVASIVVGAVEIAKTHRYWDWYDDERKDNISDVETEWINNHNAMYTTFAKAEDVPKGLMVKAYLREDAKIVARYIPGVCFMIGGIILIFESHNIMRHRLNAAAAYANGVLALFNEYRARVREDLGEEKDREYLVGASKHEYSYEGTTTTGKPRKMHGDVEVLNPDGESLYMRILDPASGKIFDEETLDVDEWVLNSYRELGNRKLAEHQVLFMDDLAELFDLDITDFPETKVTGYLYDPDWAATHDGPQFDFRVYDERPKFPESKSSVVWHGNKPKGRVWIEFLNSDGYILDQVEQMGFRGLIASNR